jgi:hypothetical protein
MRPAIGVSTQTRAAGWARAGRRDDLDPASLRRHEVDPAKLIADARGLGEADGAAGRALPGVSVTSSASSRRCAERV